jgi:predicted anti-sigma-YlaC factor YlaD
MVRLKSNPNNSHEDFEALCCLLAGGFASEAETQTLEEHLPSCPSCRKMMEDMTELTDLLRLQADVIFPPHSVASAAQE